MITDWLYRPDRMTLREGALSTLLKEFGGQLNEEGAPLHSTENIYAAAHDWVSSGNKTTDGIITFYEKHYNERQTTNC